MHSGMKELYSVIIRQPVLYGLTTLRLASTKTCIHISLLSMISDHTLQGTIGNHVIHMV